MGIFNRLFKSSTKTSSESEKLKKFPARGPIKDSLKLGMSYNEVLRILGKPTTVTDGSKILGGSGQVIASRKSVDLINAKKFYSWERPEGIYRLTFTNGIVTWIEE